MNAHQRHEVGEQATQTVIRESVACSLAKRGRHLLTVVVGSSGDLIFATSECNPDSVARESVERLGGTCCATHVAAVMQKVKESTTLSYTGDHVDKFNALPEITQRLLKKVRRVVADKRDERVRLRVTCEDPLQLSALALQASDFAKHRKLLEDRAIKILSAHASKVAGLHIEFWRGDGVWVATCGSVHVGKREFGKRGWQFDEFEIRDNIKKGDTVYLFAANASGRQALTEGENSFCLACGLQVRNRSSHSRTNKHADKVIERSRKALRLFAGPRRK